jgi:hypothetical protein
MVAILYSSLRGGYERTTHHRYNTSCPVAIGFHRPSRPRLAHQRSPYHSRYLHNYLAAEEGIQTILTFAGAYIATQVGRHRMAARCKAGLAYAVI